MVTIRLAWKKNLIKTASLFLIYRTWLPKCNRCMLTKIQNTVFVISWFSIKNCVIWIAMNFYWWKQIGSSQWPMKIFKISFNMKAQQNIFDMLNIHTQTHQRWIFDYYFPEFRYRVYYYNIHSSTYFSWIYLSNC